eukprot:scaffold112345_cov60-Phaeocystis_antarctica.AAC.3
MDRSRLSVGEILDVIIASTHEAATGLIVWEGDHACDERQHWSRSRGAVSSTLSSVREPPRRREQRRALIRQQFAFFAVGTRRVLCVSTSVNVKCVARVLWLRAKRCELG